jgi:alkyl hydroperoxide reductase subunit AhpC
MAIRLGDIAPDFQAETTEGTLKFHDWLGSSWGVLFSHPADFTPVCTTELGAVAKLRAEFDKRNVKVIAISADPLDSHKKWIGDMVHPQVSDKFTVRSVFVIGPDKKVKLTITYPASTGRNFDEILRVIDSLQLTANYSVATPANWKHGEDVIIVAAVKDEDVPGKFPKGHKRIKPYLRTTPQPNL